MEVAALGQVVEERVELIARGRLPDEFELLVELGSVDERRTSEEGEESAHSSQCNVGNGAPGG